jgi:hypothetical protein
MHLHFRELWITPAVYYVVHLPRLASTCRSVTHTYTHTDGHSHGVFCTVWTSYCLINKILKYVFFWRHLLCDRLKPNCHVTEWGALKFLGFTASDCIALYVDWLVVWLTVMVACWTTNRLRGWFLRYLSVFCHYFFPFCFKCIISWVWHPLPENCVIRKHRIQAISSYLNYKL